MTATWSARTTTAPATVAGLPRPTLVERLLTMKVPVDDHGDDQRGGADDEAGAKMKALFPFHPLVAVVRHPMLASEREPFFLLAHIPIFKSHHLEDGGLQAIPSGFPARTEKTIFGDLCLYFDAGRPARTRRASLVSVCDGCVRTKMGREEEEPFLPSSVHVAVVSFWLTQRQGKAALRVLRESARAFDIQCARERKFSGPLS